MIFLQKRAFFDGFVNNNYCLGEPECEGGDPRAEEGGEGHALQPQVKITNLMI